MAGRVRAAVDRRSQPDVAGGRRLGGRPGGWAPGGITYPDEDLLAGLGAATRLFGELDDRAAGARTGRRRAGHGRARSAFLKRDRPAAGRGRVRGAAAGLGPQGPARPEAHHPDQRGTGADGAGSGAGFGLHDLVDFRYDLAVGDQTLDPGELAELARLKVPLVRIRGQWVELDERHLKAALKFLERGRLRRDDRRRRAAGRPARARRGPAASPTVDADGWLGDLLSGQAERRLAPLATPASFRGELRPYQERGLAWLSFLGNLGLGADPRRRHGPGQVPADAGAARARAGRRRRGRADAAGVPDVAGRQLAAGGGAVHPGPARCTCTTAPTGWPGRSWPGRARRG